MIDIRDPRLEEQALFINRRVIENLMQQVRHLWQFVPHTFDGALHAIHVARDYAERVTLPWPKVQIAVDEISNAITVQWQLGGMIAVQALGENESQPLVQMPTDTVDAEFLQELVKDMTNNQLAAVKALLEGLDLWLTSTRSRVVPIHEVEEWQKKIKGVMP